MPLALAKAIPDQVINEGATYKPFSLKEFIQSTASHLRFQAELSDGRPIPQGLICTGDGILTGIPALGTEGSYVVVLRIEDIEGDTFTTQFNLMIKPVNVDQPQSLLRDLKNQVWAAVGKGEAIPTMPDLAGIFNWPVTSSEVYYLLERFAYLTVWDAYNLDAPGKLISIELKGASNKYHVYDRGSCLVATPKDLYTHERTPYDSLITARAVAEEVYKRGWTIEFSGFDKMVRAAWVRLQILGAHEGKNVEILHYNPLPEDAVIYAKEMEAEAQAKPAP